MRPAILLPGDRTEYGVVLDVEAMDYFGKRYRVRFRRPDGGVRVRRLLRNTEVQASATGSMIIVGEQHSREGQEELPAFDPGAGGGKRLQALLGRSRPLSELITDNLLPAGEWNPAQAHLRADWLLENCPDVDRWLLAGRKVAAAFGLKADWLTWTEHRGRLMAVIPHPSGRNRYWNDPVATYRAKKFLRRAVDAGRAA
jgi:hypothetical protein